MIYVGEEEEGTGGVCNTYTKRYKAINACAGVNTYLPTFEFHGSKFFRSLMETPKNGDLERRSKVEEPFPRVLSLMFKTLV